MSDDWAYLLIAFAGLTLTTVGTRSSFFLLPQTLQLPPLVERALRYAPACALTAIIVPDVLTRDGEVFISWHNNGLWAAIVAGAVFAKTRNMMIMMAVGMAVFTVLRLTT